MRPTGADATAPRLQIGVIGPGDGVPGDHLELARQVGRLVAQAGHVVVTGGLRGVMAAACEGAREQGGVTLGILPGTRRRDGNDHLTVAVPSGMGELRNGLVVRAADAIISIGGSWGTLSEVALAMRMGVPVVALDGWALPEAGIIRAESPARAVEEALRAEALHVGDAQQAT